MNKIRKEIEKPYRRANARATQARYRCLLQHLLSASNTRIYVKDNIIRFFGAA